MKKCKSAEKRKEEVQTIMEKFLDLGFPLDHPGTQLFIKVTNDFVNHGYSASGTINFKEYILDAITYRKQSCTKKCVKP